MILYRYPLPFYPLPERAMIRFITVRDVVLACIEICHHSCTHTPAFMLYRIASRLFIIISPGALAVSLLSAFAHDYHRRATLHTAYCIKLYIFIHWRSSLYLYRSNLFVCNPALLYSTLRRFPSTQHPKERREKERKPTSTNGKAEHTSISIFSYSTSRG